MPKIDPRDERMFPKLNAAEIDRLGRFGQMRRYGKDQPLFVTGETAPGMFVLKTGRVKATRRDPLGHLAPIVEQGPGDFVAEVGQLSGRPALVDVHAIEDVETYWASPIEARLCRREEVALVGAGNSAGQAAVFLRDYAAKIWLLARGPSPAQSMSQYLIDRINATPNIEVLTNTEVVALSGSPQGQLERIRWRHRLSGKETEKPLHHLFLFIGADPATNWLQGCVSLDAKGFVQTGARVPAQDLGPDNATAQPQSLQSSVPGVFAVGDVRSGSVKRVGAAIGEGAAVVAQLHAYLGARRNASADTQLKTRAS
jgi:pyruvate/2-oxoglutarate dehydrogenase complex dihydrolipoamide dehydrogenase (E3) component